MNNESKAIKSGVGEPLLDNSVRNLKTKGDDGTENDHKERKPVEIIRNKSVVLLEKKKNEKPMEKWKLVPPDGGWGWLILFGSTLVNILVPGTIKSFGVLFVDYLEAFEASTAQGMWIPALCYFLYSSLGPISSILSVKYSYRTVTFIGGACAAGGWILSFWASSIPYLYFSYGILVGCGAGLSFPPTVYIVTSYFLRLRGIANGICISGSAFGSILLPPLLRVMLEAYGYRGAVLLMGGLTLNVFVAALFYVPVEKHMKKVPIEEETENEADELNRVLSRFIVSEDSMASLPQIPHNESFIDHIDSSDGHFNRSASSAAMQNVKPYQRERKISMPTGRQEVMRAKAGYGSPNMNSSSALHSVPEKENGEALDIYSYGRIPSSRRPRSGIPPRSTSTSSFQYISTPYHGSTLTLQPETFASSFSLRSISLKAKGPEKQDGAKKVKLLDLALLKDPIYLIILISNATNAISYTNFIILLPKYATDLGFDKDSGALLLSIVSALDLLGRIGGSALSDVTSFPKSYYFVSGLFISGISLAVLPFFTTYWLIGLFCSIFGLASGTYVGITAIVMADMLGEERLQSSYGISLFVNGVLQLIGPPICGVWFEAANSFVSLFCFLGTTLAAGSLLWGLIPCFRKNDNNIDDDSGDEDDEEDKSP